jgi:hypothetical protein
MCAYMCAFYWVAEHAQTVFPVRFVCASCGGPAIGSWALTPDQPQHADGCKQRDAMFPRSRRI